MVNNRKILYLLGIVVIVVIVLCSVLLTRKKKDKRIGKLHPGYLDAIQNHLPTAKDIPDILSVSLLGYENDFSWADVSTDIPVKNHLNKDICGNIWNQGNCGACWFFSTLQMILEVGVMNRTSLTPQVSNWQRLSVEFEKDYKYCICGGGSPDLMLWLVATYGIKDYSSSSLSISKKDWACLSTDYHNWGENTHYILPNSNIPSKEYVANHNISSMNSYVGNLNNNYNMTNIKLQKVIKKHGPVTVLVYAENWSDYEHDTNAFIPYRESRPLSQNNPDHAVQCVGWTTKDNKYYWIVRNQWGKGWGLNGYIMVNWGNSPFDCFYNITYIKEGVVDLGNYNSPQSGIQIGSMNS
tara:strand:- start:199 stop:1257 length:1059 start_codon:yes stop_codon:yes gene_type:complete